MTTFPDRVRRFARAARQLPNNAAAVRAQLDALTTFEAEPAVNPQEPTGSAAEAANAETAARWDVVATSIPTPHPREPRPEGISVLTAWNQPSRDVVDALAIEPEHTVLLAPGAEMTQPVVEHDRTVLRTPEPLDWRRAVYPLLRAAPTRHAVVLHPGVRPRRGAAELWRSRSAEAALVCGTVTAADSSGATVRAAPECLALVDVDVVAACLHGLFRRQACTGELPELLAHAGEVVVRAPRLVGSLTTNESAGKHEAAFAPASRPAL